MIFGNRAYVEKEGIYRIISRFGVESFNNNYQDTLIKIEEIKQNKIKMVYKTINDKYYSKKFSKENFIILLNNTFYRFKLEMEKEIEDYRHIEMLNNRWD